MSPVLVVHLKLAKCLVRGECLDFECQNHEVVRDVQIEQGPVHRLQRHIEKRSLLEVMPNRSKTHSTLKMVAHL